MGIKTKTVEIKVCDCCGKEIRGRLVVHVCPCCGNEICPSCQQKEDAKKHLSLTLPKTKQIKPVSFSPSLCEGLDLSTFSVKVGQGKEADELKLGQFTVKHQELKEGAKELLALAKLTLEDVEKAPDSQGKEELLSILKC